MGQSRATLLFVGSLSDVEGGPLSTCERHRRGCAHGARVGTAAEMNDNLRSVGPIHSTRIVASAQLGGLATNTRPGSSPQSSNAPRLSTPRRE